MTASNTWPRCTVVASNLDSLSLAPASGDLEPAAAGAVVCLRGSGTHVSDDAPKSAYELAMERLRRKDAEQGVVPMSLSDDQRQEIAEIRRVAEARLAEVEILHKSKTAGVFDPAVLVPLEQEYRREVQRITEQRDARILGVRERGR
jgi:hypothetical protein